MYINVGMHYFLQSVLANNIHLKIFSKNIHAVPNIHVKYSVKFALS